MSHLAQALERDAHPAAIDKWLVAVSSRSKIARTTVVDPAPLDPIGCATRVRAPVPAKLGHSVHAVGVATSGRTFGRIHRTITSS